MNDIIYVCEYYKIPYVVPHLQDYTMSENIIYFKSTPYSFEDLSTLTWEVICLINSYSFTKYGMRKWVNVKFPEMIEMIYE